MHATWAQSSRVDGLLGLPRETLPVCAHTRVSSASQSPETRAFSQVRHREEDPQGATRREKRDHI